MLLMLLHFLTATTYLFLTVRLMSEKWKLVQNRQVVNAAFYNLFIRRKDVLQLMTSSSSDDRSNILTPLQSMTDCVCARWTSKWFCWNVLKCDRSLSKSMSLVMSGESRVSITPSASPFAKSVWPSFPTCGSGLKRKKKHSFYWP